MAVCEFGILARSFAFTSGNKTDFKAAKYGLRKAITTAKRPYREKLDSLADVARPAAHHRLQDLHQLFYQLLREPAMTSTPSTPVSRPPVSIQKGGMRTPGPHNPSPHTLSSEEVHEALRRINPHKAAGPDNIPGGALRACATELAEVLTSLFNLSISQSIVPTCFKTTTIVPLPKKRPLTCLNDYRPVAFTPIIGDDIVDMRKKRSIHQPLFIRVLEVGRCAALNSWGPHQYTDFTWSLNTTQLVKKAQQRLALQRTMRKFGMSAKILNNFNTL